MDLGSAFSVMSLQIDKCKQQGNLRVLDMCCAPGAKYCFIADMLKYHRKQDYQLFGVDVSKNRLNICRNLAKKYGHVDQHEQNIKYELILGDSREYTNDEQFDKVLVDVECTHEGSIKHLIKWVNKWNENKKQNKINSKQNDKMGWTV